MLASCSPQPNCMPKNPKLMLKSCQKLRRGFSRCFSMEKKLVGNPRSTKDLGARCIWLMPVDASPSYHGYDVKNYYRVNPEYGSNQDFKRFIVAAHKRGIRVLVDLVLNHASSEHPFFKEALRDT